MPWEGMKVFKIISSNIMCFSVNLVSLQWSPPNKNLRGDGDVVFKASIVQDYVTFWSDSKILKFDELNNLSTKQVSFNLMIYVVML